MSKLEGAWIPRKMRGIHAPVEAAAGPRCRFPEFFGREWKRHSICSRYMRAKVLVSWLSYFRVGLSRWRKTPRNKRKGKIMSELTRPVLFRVAVIAMALALSAVAQGQFNYTTNHGAITIAGYTGPGGAVYIPARIGGLPVTGIGVAAFEDCGSLTDITIPDGVTIIGDYAFAFCTFLTNVTIPNTVASIGSGAFYACSWLKSVAIPDSVTNLGNFAFAESGLASATIPKSITVIGDYTFQYCGLSSVAIPDSVTAIGAGAFSGSGLKSVTIPNGVTSIGASAFSPCVILTNATIPASVTSIGSYTFSECGNLRAVYFQGNAPRGDWSVFHNDDFLTLYYLPGTTGLGSTFGFPQFGCPPAVLWNPEAQTGGASFGVRTNHFGFAITGSSGLVIVVEATANLANPTWSPVHTNTLTALAQAVLAHLGEGNVHVVGPGR